MKKRTKTWFLQAECKAETAWCTISLSKQFFECCKNAKSTFIFEVELFFTEDKSTGQFAGWGSNEHVFKLPSLTEGVEKTCNLTILRGQGQGKGWLSIPNGR